MCAFLCNTLTVLAKNSALYQNLTTVGLCVQTMWELLGAGGNSDPHTLECPGCSDPTAMHQGQSHLHVFNSAALMPVETIQACVASQLDCAQTWCRNCAATLLGQSVGPRRPLFASSQSS